MTDERLRKLERRFQETGAAEDEEAWLRARLRVGDITEARLGLAACLGHAASAAILGREVGFPDLVDDASHMPESAFIGTMRPDHPWMQQVFRVGTEACARICVALGYRVLPEWLRLHPKDPWATGLLAASDAWIESPKPSRLKRLQQRPEPDPAREELCTPRHPAIAPDFPNDTLADKVYWSYRRVFRDVEFGAYHALMGVSGIAGYAAMEGAREVRDLAEDSASRRIYALILCQGLNGTTFACGAEAVREALRFEVVPWALGIQDFVAERRQASRTRVSLRDPANPRLNRGD